MTYRSRSSHARFGRLCTWTVVTVALLGCAPKQASRPAETTSLTVPPLPRGASKTAPAPATVPALSPADLRETWLELPVPSGAEAPHLVRDSEGFLAVARVGGGGKVSTPVASYVYRSRDGVHWRRVLD